MSRISTPLAAAVFAAIVAMQLAGCTQEPSQSYKAHNTLFIGVDASGSFKNSGYYDNALLFLAHYIYGHLHALGGLDKPQAMFIASVGGKDLREPKSFHPIHDFENKDIAGLEFGSQRMARTIGALHSHGQHIFDSSTGRKNASALKRA